MGAWPTCPMITGKAGRRALAGRRPRGVKINSRTRETRRGFSPAASSRYARLVVPLQTSPADVLSVVATFVALAISIASFITGRIDVGRARAGERDANERAVRSAAAAEASASSAAALADQARRANELREEREARLLAAQDEEQARLLSVVHRRLPGQNGQVVHLVTVENRSREPIKDLTVFLFSPSAGLASSLERCHLRRRSRLVNFRATWTTMCASSLSRYQRPSGALPTGSSSSSHCSSPTPGTSGGIGARTERTSVETPTSRPSKFSSTSRALG